MFVFSPRKIVENGETRNAATYLRKVVCILTFIGGDKEEKLSQDTCMIELNNYSLRLSQMKMFL